MKQKQLILMGITLVVLALVVFAVLRPADPKAETSETAIVELTYCNEKQIKPCVVSFGLDADNNMLVNFLLPDLAYPEFYLQVARGDATASYKCQRIASALNNAYCIGEKLPPGETLHLTLISRKNDAVLAEGNLSIIGLAFPTIEITTPTDLPTEKPVTTSPTDSSVKATSTPTPTPTLRSYP